MVSITISLSSNNETFAITAAITSEMAKFVQYNSEVEMIIGYAETAGGQTQQDRTNYCPFLLPSLLSSLSFAIHVTSELQKSFMKHQTDCTCQHYLSSPLFVIVRMMLWSSQGIMGNNSEVLMACE